jgi:RNA polymerase sigma-70 factor, ECF subfamily
VISMALNEPFLAQQLVQKNELAFEQVFKTHFKNLHAYACTIVKDSPAAEGIVQNVFLKLWDRGENLNISSSVTAYLYRAVYNESCNHIKHQKVKQSYSQHAARSMSTATNETASKKVLLAELEQKIKTALSELPEQCRTVFQMSRFEELKYQEIADKLGISIKTVEAHMGKALKLLRLKLVDYLHLITLFFNLSILFI